MFDPQRVLISRHGGDPQHPFRDVPGLMMDVPSVGDSLQMFLDDGQVMRTSEVTHVETDGTELVVETRNSRYLLKLAS